MPTSKPPLAFIAAGAVLLVMPLLVAIGIGGLALTAGLPNSDPRATRVMLIGSSSGSAWSRSSLRCSSSNLFAARAAT